MVAAISAAAVVGSAVISSQSQQSAADSASKSQQQASNASIAASQQQFDATKALLKPYTDVGPKALGVQQDILGLNGNTAQANSYSDVQNSPYFASMTKAGENGILQNASATGGLRGGNTEAALAQFRPQLLNQLIQQKYQNLSGMTSIGQNAAAGVGNAGMQSSNQVINALNQSGAAQAGSYLAGGQANANMWNGIGSTASMIGTNYYLNQGAATPYNGAALGRTYGSGAMQTDGVPL